MGAGYDWPALFFALTYSCLWHLFGLYIIYSIPFYMPMPTYLFPVLFLLIGTTWVEVLNGTTGWWTPWKILILTVLTSSSSLVSVYDVSFAALLAYASSMYTVFWGIVLFILCTSNLDYMDECVVNYIDSLGIKVLTFTRFTWFSPVASCLLLPSTHHFPEFEIHELTCIRVLLF